MRELAPIVKMLMKKELLLLFLIIFIVYNLNCRVIDSGDTVPASLLPFCILDNHNLYFDQFIGYYYDLGVHPYFFSKVNSHYVSTYPIVTPILITPLYILPYAILKLLSYPLDLTNPVFYGLVLVMEKISASLIGTLAGLFVYLSLKELINRRYALIGTLIFAFGTNTWVIGSQALWQQGMVELLLAAMIYFIVLNEKRPDEKYLLFLGVLSGLFIFNRVSDLILLLPVMAYVLLHIRNVKKIAYYAFSMLIVSLPLLLYNLHYFQSVFGGYGSVTSLFNVSGFITGFAGLLISPNRGLIIYSPIVLLAIPGYLLVSKIGESRLRKVLYLFGFAIFVQIIIYGIFEQWHGGTTFGPRFLTAILPVLSIYITMFIYHIYNKDNKNNVNIIVTVLILAMVLWSVFVQVQGAFCYTNGGYTWDADLLQKHINGVGEKEYFWDWSDTQIGRCIKTGPGGFTFLKILSG